MAKPVNGRDAKSASMTQTMRGPLDGIKVLDLTRLLPGNLCTMLLADLGADVLKVEEPGRGDYIRSVGPIRTQDSYLHLVLNRNKRSLTLNLKTEEGKAILGDLVRNADVLAEGFRPGVMDRLGIGYEALREINPRLVYCAISGYGQDGPYRHLPGHDLNYMGVGGALELFGYEDRPPTVPGLSIADIGGGSQMAIIGILSALVARQSMGQGQLVDVAMTDGVVYWLSLHAGWYFGTGRSPRRGETLLLGRYPCYAVYETADGGNLTVGCLEEHFWANLCKAIDREAYIPLQISEERRVEIFADLQDIFRTRTRTEWMEFFADKNVCVGPSYLVEEALEDPQVRHREMFTQMEHSVEGTIHQLGIPIKLSGTPGSIRLPPPTLGEHTDSVLRSLGYDDAAIAQFRASGVV
jgi:crotonobetainyl-CoA:carnitine CoA-transferase CaiB-like acyl-CoA transferase